MFSLPGLTIYIIFLAIIILIIKQINSFRNPIPYHEIKGVLANLSQDSEGSNPAMKFHVLYSYTQIRYDIMIETSIYINLLIII